MTDEEKLLPEDKLLLEAFLCSLHKVNVPDGYISFFGYAKDAVCLEKRQRTWMVYTGCRSKKTDLTFHDSLRSALDDMFCRLALDGEMLEEFHKHFSEYLADQKQ